MKTFEIVRDMVKTSFDKEVKKDDTLKDLGIDSLEFLTFIVDLEESFNIKLDESELINVVTVKDIVDLIDKTKKS